MQRSESARAPFTSGDRAHGASPHADTAGLPGRYSPEPPRVGLVLGGGGILGGAWLVGALHALQQATGWDPWRASHIVGTSAGSVVGALVAEGMPPWFLVYHQRGGDVGGMTDRYGEPLDGAEEASRRFITWTGQLPRPVLGSPRLVLRTALQPWRYPPMTALSGWIGRGFLSTDEIGKVVRSVVKEGWSSHPNLWIVAVDYASGRRVVFGRNGTVEADLPDAVRASCSIPGLYRPTQIGGRLYIDGGVWSPSNLDLLSHDDVALDIVIVLNPMSTLQPGLPTTVIERIDRRVRIASGRRLGREARRLREKGTAVLLLQPEREDLDAMGFNLMDPTRRVQVLETAIRTTGRRLAAPDALAVLGKLRKPDTALA